MAAARTWSGTMTTLCKECGLPPEAPIHYTGGHPTRCHVFVDSGRCPKHTRKSPCSGEVAGLICGEPDRRDRPCTDRFLRCDAHGGAAGAARSLKSHRGVYHPKAESR